MSTTGVELWRKRALSLKSLGDVLRVSRGVQRKTSMALEREAGRIDV